MTNLLFVLATVAGVALIVASAWLAWPPAGCFVAGFVLLVLARQIAEVPDAD